MDSASPSPVMTHTLRSGFVTQSVAKAGPVRGWWKPYVFM